MKTEMINILSIDVEDYYHVSAFEAISPPSSWKSCEPRVDRNTEKVLAILAEAGVKATFFVLGWVAARFPELVRRIAAEGHEVASHGYLHRRVGTQDRREFREDIRHSKAILEDLAGEPVLGYRAPSYSISSDTLWAFDELWEAGYGYDSSVFPVRHDLYGLPDWPRFSFCAARTDGGRWAPEAWRGAPEGESVRRIREIPITTLEFNGFSVPIAGGGYFRLFPYSVTRWGLRRINRRDAMPFVFYLHPWEFDPGQPRMAGAGWKSSFRHYINLDETETRFRSLLRDFAFAPIREFLPEAAYGDVRSGVADGQKDFVRSRYPVTFPHG